MARFVLRRLVELPISLLAISLIVFGILHVSPGNPIDFVVEAGASPEVRSALEQYYGLDRPLAIQYARWIAKVARGDLGTSILTSRPVRREIGERFPATWLLATVAIIVAGVAAMPFAMVAAVRRNTRIDRLVASVSALLLSFPTYVVAPLLILLFAVRLRLLPSSGAPSLLRDPVGALPFYILPVVALALPRIGALTRILRASVVEVLSADYVRVARAKGLSIGTVVGKHAMRNALLPFVTILGINYAYLLGGAVITEAIFGIPGMGLLLIEGVLRRDFPVVQGVALVAGLFFVGVNLMVDLLYARLDPRIKYS